jgi:F-type H+-transporting ATPase subunit a
MTLLLLSLLLQATPAVPSSASSPAVAAQATPVAAPQAVPPPAEGAEAKGAAEAGEEVHDPAVLIAHHVLDHPVFGFPSRHLLYFVLATLLVILTTRTAIRSYRGGSVPRGLGALVEIVVLFVRDEIAEPSIGHGEGRRFTPLLCSFFFFILTAALLGLVPLPGYDAGKWSVVGTTSTGNLAVTMALALVSFAAQQFAGIAKYGVVGHFRNLIPPGMPLALVPIMIPVEILSMFTKPFALMIRLFANMLAGHMVITTLILLISLMAQGHWMGGVAMAPVSIGLALFIMLLEILVAIIQAYIFTLLSAIFIGMYAHPAH